MSLKIKILENELWYGLASDEGCEMPFDKNSVYTFNMQPVNTPNQYSPLLVSNMGRYVWGNDGFNTTFENGSIEITSSLAPARLYEGFGDLRGAFTAAAKAHFPSNGVLPPIEFFEKPQYNTWIEFIYNQNQNGIYSYCKTIHDNDMPTGVVMIDDMWSNYYGRWDFDRKKFPEPKKLIDALHEWGFKVMLWICPFVSLDSEEFRYLRDNGALVRDKDDNPRLVRWWNGYSAVLDLSNPFDHDWLTKQCDFLTETYGVDGFKLDAGDARFYLDTDKNYGNVTPNEQCELWAKFGLKYAYNEFRACYKCAGLPLVQRLQDKGHRWTDKGIEQLVPNMLAQGILGYAYGCPDMVGGGQYLDFLPGAKQFEPELFVRYAATSMLMPMIQFSTAPWRVLDDTHYGYVKTLLKIRDEFVPVISRLAKEAANSGEPIVRYLEYVFPHEGLGHITDEFMLGNDILVAPVLEKGRLERNVILPRGLWRERATGKLYEGGTTVNVSAKLDELPIFIKE
ncbi:MAG: glycoside hydrolase [Clostridia bacterium]|nr:glycoside hydrolase [Clostridia bacterium]